MFKHIPVEIDQLKRKNTEKGRRYQTPSGVLYPSVTTILSHKSKPYIDAWKKKIGEAEANKISSRAAKRGTSMHKLVEYHLLNETNLHEEGVQSLDMLDKEMYMNNMKPLLSDIDNIRALEATMYSDHLRLGGQADCIAEYKGRLSVIDFKTSNKRKTRSQCYNYFIQCSAYAIMFEERTGIPVDQTVILMAQQDDGPAVFTATRDEFVPKLLDARDDYEVSQL
jgi:genome maintenance exonuclease 1|tara:strand:- start:20471 stop:21142 length:672 start_codon:yes stop_codon:yes gene_type:complete